MGSDRPGRCDEDTPAGAEDRRLSAGSLPYTPHVPSSGTVGVHGMLDRAEGLRVTGVMGVIDRVTPGVSWAARSTYPSDAALRGVIWRPPGAADETWTFVGKSNARSPRTITGRLVGS